MIGTVLTIGGFVQFVHNFAMIQAYSSLAVVSGLTEEFYHVYEKEILEAQIALALGLLGFFIAIYACILVTPEPEEEKVKPSGIEYERRGLTWKKTAQPPEQTEESVSQET